MEQIIVKVDIDPRDEEHCGNCESMKGGFEPYECGIFHSQLRRDKKTFGLLRCAQCKTAVAKTKAGKVCKVRKLRYGD